jgi:hypothetical protein
VLAVERALDPGCHLGRVERVVHQIPHDVREHDADEVARVAHPVVRRQRVGARVCDESVRVQPDQAVARPRAADGADRLGGGWKGAVGDHLAQVGGAAEVGDLQRAGHAGQGEIRVAREHADHRAAVPHGDGLPPHRYLQVPARVLLAADAPFDDGPPQLRALGRADARRHDVLRVGGWRRGGPGLGHAEELRAAGQRDPQEEIGERHVRQQLPLRDDALQVLDRITTQLGVLGEQLTQG